MKILSVRCSPSSPYYPSVSLLSTAAGPSSLSNFSISENLLAKLGLSPAPVGDPGTSASPSPEAVHALEALRSLHQQDAAVSNMVLSLPASTALVPSSFGFSAPSGVGCNAAGSNMANLMVNGQITPKRHHCEVCAKQFQSPSHLR